MLTYRHFHSIHNHPITLKEKDSPLTRVKIDTSSNTSSEVQGHLDLNKMNGRHTKASMYSDMKAYGMQIIPYELKSKESSTLKDFNEI